MINRLAVYFSVVFSIFQTVVCGKIPLLERAVLGQARAMIGFLVVVYKFYRLNFITDEFYNILFPFKLYKLKVADVII